MKATGYLHWLASWKVNPIVEVTGSGWRVARGGEVLQEELSRL